MATAAAFALVPVAAAAQLAPPPDDFSTRSYVTLGYIANAPDLFRGGGVAYLTPRLVGVFADLKMSGGSPADRDNFQGNWTVDQAQNEFGDFNVATKSDWLVVNAGLTRVIGPELAIYAGGGFARRRTFREFHDDREQSEDQRGEFGYYWVEDDEESGNFPNLMGGLYFRAGRSLMFQFGVESEPRGMTVGVHYALPLRR